MDKGRRTVNTMPAGRLVFLDSSVLFSAVNSPTGGSAKLFVFPQTKLFVSKIVLHKVEKNVRAKLQNYHLDRLFMLVEKTSILEGIPKDNQIEDAKGVIAEKDAVILASVKNSKCDYLVTLDKKDFLQERVFEYIKPKKIVTPKMFFDL